jgi:hypothetical protein
MKRVYDFARPQTNGAGGAGATDATLADMRCVA